MKLHNHKNNIRLSFNRAALTYDQGSYPQQIIGSQLIHLLCKYMTKCNASIDLGCGTGISTEQLARCINSAASYAIDISDELIAQAKTRLQPHGIHVSAHDFEQLTFNDLFFDLVFSNMALHWSADFFTNLQTIHQIISPSGLIAFTIPLDGTFTEINTSSRNEFLHLSHVQQQMEDTGFTLLECFSDCMTFAYSSRLTALKSIRATGANYLVNRKNKSLASSPQMDAMQHKLSYNIGYFIGRKTHVI